MEAIWAKKLEITTICKEVWGDIYQLKCHSLYNVRLCMFNYKILTNSLPSPIQLNKWNKDINKDCELCMVPDNIVHVISECIIVRDVWKTIEKNLRCKLKTSNIILGINACRDSTNICKPKEEIVSYIAYFLYTYKMNCKNKKSIYSKGNLKSYIINQLAEVCIIYEQINVSISNIGKRIVEELKTS